MSDDAGARDASRREDDQDRLTEEAVRRFLTDHPDFLARHPSLYLTLAPPARVHGERFADHMAALLAAARRQNAILDEGVRHRRADASFTLRVEAALLGAVRSADPVEWIASELAVTLGIDSASICLEDARPHTRTLAPGGIAPLLAGVDIRFRPEPHEAGPIHGEAASLARRDVLVRLVLADGTGVLALGSRDEAALPGPGTERALTLLARGVEAALERPRELGTAGERQDGIAPGHRGGAASEARGGAALEACGGAALEARGGAALEAHGRTASEARDGTAPESRGGAASEQSRRAASGPSGEAAEQRHAGTASGQDRGGAASEPP